MPPLLTDYTRDPIFSSARLLPTELDYFKMPAVSVLRPKTTLELNIIDSRI